MTKKISAIPIISILLCILFSGCSSPASNTISNTHSEPCESISTTSTISPAPEKPAASEHTEAEISTVDQPDDVEPETTPSSLVDTTSEPVTNDPTPPETDKSTTTTEIPTTSTANTPTQNETQEPALQTPTVQTPSKSTPVTAISIDYSGYISENEKKPYIKSTPIYGVLYSGSRVQVKDSVIFSLSITPADHTDKLIIEASKGLSYSLSGNLLTVTVESDDNYGAGRISIYTISDNGAISASANYNFAIDPLGDPFHDMSEILSTYIRKCGMVYTSFENGYTFDNPACSITKYPGAPAWDDMIDKSQSGWISRSFWLIDQYKAIGFTKANFIITDTAVGFSASK